MNGSDAHPASMVNKIIWSCYVTLDSLISSPVLAEWASDPFMLPPCMYCSAQPCLASYQPLAYLLQVCAVAEWCEACHSANTYTT